MIVRKRDQDEAEISMSPMIDMVFLLLVFFLVAAKPVKEEADLGMTLPGAVEQSESLDIPDEQSIEIRRDGQVVLNEMEMDSPASRDLPELVQVLKRFKEAAAANKSEALVTLAPDDDATHQRIADVMNACAQADITGVTFSGASEEEEF